MAAMKLSHDPLDLTEVVRQARAEPLVIEEEGKVVAVVLSVELYEQLSRTTPPQDHAELRRLLVERLEADPAEDEILTPELWRQLTTGACVEISPDSLAVPPGWRK